MDDIIHFYYYMFYFLLYYYTYIYITDGVRNGAREGPGKVGGEEEDRAAEEERQCGTAGLQRQGAGCGYRGVI